MCSLSSTNKIQMLQFNFLWLLIWSTELFNIDDDDDDGNNNIISTLVINYTAL